MTYKLPSRVRVGGFCDNFHTIFKIVLPLFRHIWEKFSEMWQGNFAKYKRNFCNSNAKSKCFKFRDVLWQDIVGKKISESLWTSAHKRPYRRKLNGSVHRGQRNIQAQGN